MQQVIKNKLWQVVQDVNQRQHLSGSGKNVQMALIVNIFGDDAIRRAAAADGDIKEAMKFILQSLPEPRLVFLKALAMQAAIELEGSRPSAARYLNVSERTICDRRISWVGLFEELDHHGFGGQSERSTEGPGEGDPVLEVDR